MKRVNALHLLLTGLLLWRAFVAKDRRVDTISESQAAVVRHHIREGADPVVVDWLVCLQLSMTSAPSSEENRRGDKTYHERVPLGDENLELVNDQRLGVLTVGLDDGHRVPSDREVVVRVAGDVDQPEPVAGGNK